MFGFFFCTKGRVTIVQSDYYARTGGIQETILDDDNTFLNVPEDYENGEQCLRRSQDSGTMNARGRNFSDHCHLSFAIKANLFVTWKVKRPAFTITVAGSKSILRKVQYLIVNPLMPHLSDHCNLSFATKANFIDQDSLETSTELTLTEYNRLFWNIKSKDRLKDGIKSQTVQSRLEAAVKHDSIDIASELRSETLMEACKEAGLKARSSKIKCKSQNKWFDQECETEKGNLQSLGEKISKNPYCSELRQLLSDKKKRFKETCRRKKREYISKGMSNIDMQNSKET